MSAAPEPTDFALLDGWIRGDLRAGSELFERHFDEIFRFFANKVGDDAADLVQRTFLACVESRERFRRLSSFRTYMYGVARNVLLEHFRGRKKQEVDLAVSTLADLGPSPVTMIGRKEEQRRVLEALRTIPIDLQIALELYYFEQLTAVELAEVFDVPEGTVRSRVRRAREAFEESLAALERSPDKLASTVSDLDAWAASLREAMLDLKPSPVVRPKKTVEL